MHFLKNIIMGLMGSEMDERGAIKMSVKVGVALVDFVRWKGLI